MKDMQVRQESLATELRKQYGQLVAEIQTVNRETTLLTGFGSTQPSQVEEVYNKIIELLLETPSRIPPKIAKSDSTLIADLAADHTETRMGVSNLIRQIIKEGGDSDETPSIDLNRAREWLEAAKSTKRLRWVALATSVIYIGGFVTLGVAQVNGTFPAQQLGRALGPTSWGWRIVGLLPVAHFIDRFTLLGRGNMRIRFGEGEETDRELTGWEKASDQIQLTARWVENNINKKIFCQS
jgi:hypothetical protein